MKTGVVAVLEIIGKGIEELKAEKEALECERNTLRESCDFAFNRLRAVEKERDDLKAQLEVIQGYADSLAAKCENVSKTEEIKESGC